MSISDAARKAISSFVIEGEIVNKEGKSVTIRRGGSVYEVPAADVLETRELEGGRSRVLVKSNAELVRTTLVRTDWFGGARGWRPVFDDCTECCDCTECSVCSDCTECSVCTECSDFPGFHGGGYRSAWIRRLAGMGGFFRSPR